MNDINMMERGVCFTSVAKMFFLFIMFMMMTFVTYCIISIYITICEWKPFLVDVRDGIMLME
jgi:hypothetical protein